LGIVTAAAIGVLGVLGDVGAGVLLPPQPAIAVASTIPIATRKEIIRPPQINGCGNQEQCDCHAKVLYFAGAEEVSDYEVLN
jgi:hypothetical protein